MASVGTLTVDVRLNIPEETVRTCEFIIREALNSIPDCENVVYVAGKEGINGYYKVIENNDTGVVIRKWGDYVE